MSNTTSKLDQLSPEQRRLLALRLKQRKAEEPRAPAVEEGAGGEYPLAFSQQRLWMLDRLQPGSAAYNMPLAARFKQPLDPAVIGRVVGEIVRRHGVLRTRFEARDDGPVQVVEPFVNFDLPVQDLAGLPEAEREAGLARIAGEEATTPFALDQGAFRARLVRMGAADWAVLATMHHIVSDGWSLSVFWREFEELLAAFGAGLASPLPPLPVQFGEHARRERERLAGAAVDGLLAWWRNELQGAPTLLEIPTDRPRPAVASQRGSAYVTELDASFAERVSALALREGTTPFNVLLAVFQLLLGRYADTDDLLVGTAAAGRRTRDVEPLIGFFANTLVLRADLSGEPTFRQLLARVHGATMGAFEHQDLPFERLVEEMAPERTLAYSPLVQALFVQHAAYPGQGEDEGAEDDGTVEGVQQELNAAKFDLTFGVAQDAGRTWAGVEYAADLFDGATIERMVRHYATLLDSALASPDTAVASLEMMPAEERDAVRAMGAAVAHHPVSTTLHDAFAAQAARTPDAPALTYGDDTITYAELDAHADRLARRLRARGAGADVLVGLCVERSMETVVGILGILKAGAAYLPLDPAYPDDRLAYMLEDSGARLVVTAGDAADRLPPSVDLVRMEDEEPRGESGDFYTNLTPAPTAPDALAYVIYTSGSTGRPKGVQVTHANVIRLMTATDPWFGFGADDVWTLFHSYAFDFSVWEIWGALLYGGRLLVVPFEVSRDPARFHALLRDERVTVLNQTPSAFRQLIRADDDAAAAGEVADLALRYVIFGGEALDPASLRAWVDRHGADRPRLVNMYGITETTVHVTYRVITEDDVRAGSASPIGVPIPDLSVHLLDRRGRIVPIGLAGEMYVGGGGVARGYLGRPELTAQRFVPDPFADDVDARLYRSGDLARRLAAGSLEFLGRADDQVKVRGFRIELGEIESVLLEHPAVREAVVLTRGTGDERRLVAWTVATDSVTAAELRAHLLAHLPEYMVPGAFVPMDRLPLTRNGKVDRRALPDPDAADVAGAEYVAPRTQTEQVIAALWAELLDVERVGATDRFFDLGGQSLLATRAVARIREALRVEVPVRAIFEHPALDAFAGEVDRLLRASAGVEAPPLRRAERTEDPPLSFAQERLWFIDRLEPGNPVYNMAFPLRMRGPLDTASLERAIGEVVRRHESLRTRFVPVDGRPVQRIEPAGDYALPVDEVDGAGEGHDAELARRVGEWAELPFDLERGPLFRARLLRLAADDHVLLIGMHHVVSDGWSMSVFWRELVALYRAFGAGLPSPLPELPIQYADFAVWQREWLHGEALEQQVAWWRGHLAGAPALLELPTDHTRPPVQSHRGSAVAFTIPAEVAEPVRLLARRSGATLFMALLAAWQVLLARWSGQDDVVVGTPVAGRTRGETEGLIGFFINTLPIRGDLGDDPTFAALLARVREATLGAFAHQDLPFERLVQEIQPERSLGHAPLFQAMLVLQNVPDDGEETFADDLRLEGVGGDGAGVAKVDLTLGLMELEDGSLAAGLEYAADLWDRSTMERMAGHFVHLMQSAPAAAEAPVSSLPLMPAEERDAVRAMGTAVAHHPVSTTLHDVFAAQAARTPDAPALTFGGLTLTYAELDMRANRLARRLRARGAGADVLVGLCVERSPETVVGILGILKAGAAYLPLDPAYPDDRLSYMLEDSGARLVVAAGDAVDRLPPDVDLVRLDEEDQAGADDPAPLEVSPESLAYVIYTSGSTGRPKGVQVTHANVIRLMAATDPWFGFGADDVWTLFHSYAFDFSVWEIWGALLYGGRLLVVPFEVSRDPARFHALLRDERVTVLNQTPSAFRQLIRADDDAAAAGDVADLALRYVIFGGEALDPASLRAWVDRRGADRPRLVNMYGITETTVHVTYRVITENDVRAGSASPIGIPIPDLSVHLLDRRGRTVPIGLAGEMYVGGGGVARGYLGRPELTAQRFVPDPFSDDVDARLYRSGDLARRLADGSLEFLGRADDQVKVRGFRIELGEIESVLLEHPSVREAVVLTRGTGDERRLVAWTVAADSVTAAELRAHLLGHLPEYMVPGAFVPMDRLPLTRNGKVDRRALPDPDAADVAGAEYVAPRTQTEQVIAALWAELLGVERVGATDRFFDLGGQSLLATRAVSRVREALRVEVPVRAVFEHPALDAFAGEVDRLLRASAGVEAPPLRRTERTEDPPLSFAQERLWFIDRLEPGNSVYNMPFPLRMRGPLDVDALERALGEMVRRHEVLRTRFVLVEGRPVQRVEPADGWHLPVDALDAGVADDAREAEVAARVGEWIAMPFDLERGPLFRARLLRAAPDDHVLLIGMHHSVSDGWSMSVFWRELVALYRAFGAGLPSPLPPLPIQYADFAVWQRGWLHGEALEQQVAWWREHLAGAPALLELPTDRPRPHVQSHRGGGVAFTIPAEVAEPVRLLARRSGATLFMALLAAWQVLLARWSGQDDVVVGTPVAGRTRGETEGLIGFFVNTLAIRGRLGDDPTFAALLARVREATLGAFAHQDLPFERLVQEIQPARSLGHAPLFQAMLVLQNVPDDGEDTFADDLRLEGVSGDGPGVAKVDLALGLMEAEDGSLHAALDYAADLWDRSTMERMAGHFVHLMKSAPLAPQAPVSALPLMPAEERRAVEAMGEGPEAPRAATPVHRGVALQAARTPGAVALVFGGETLTYAELDRRANRLAHRLRRLGVGPEVRAGVCMERGMEMVVTLLAVLKAGGAYVPLDPEHPAGRLAYVLDDAGVTVLLTQPRLLDRLPEHGGTTVAVDADVSVADGEPDHAPEDLVSADHLVYVIYTSGSTGRPKGAAMSHGALASYMASWQLAFPLDAGDRVLQKTPLSFDPAAIEIWTTLLAGAAVVLAEPGGHREPAYLARAIGEHAVTQLQGVPSQIRELVEAGALEGAATLRRVYVGGEALDAGLAGRIARALPAARVANLYGPTETCVAVTFHVFRAEDAGEGVPIGRPVANTRAVVLDAALRLVPVGVPGELFIGGAQVGRGYPGRPALTAERFVPDPFSARPGARMYRTGDRVRWRADGALDFLGRVDFQVKLRGFRVEPGEVEAEILRHPAVAGAAVMVRDGSAGPRLVAYVVARAGAAAPDAAALRAFLAASLPEHMVPAAFVAMEALPLTTSGKTDRNALPEPDADAGAGYVPPRTQTEQVLAAVWAELLGVARVGVEDGFFDLGGHSLLATRVVSRVRGDLGVEVPVRALFEHPVLGAFAGEVDRLLRASAGTEAPPIRPADRSGDLPLSFAQERLWFVDRLEPGSPVYHMPSSYLLRGPLDVDALRRALTEIVRRHEPLRTALPFTGEQPVQRILPAAPVELPVHDVSAIADEAGRDAATEAVMRDVAQRAFDLERGPLFRAALVRMADDQHVLAVNLHHVISDGWSAGVLWNELSALYAAFRRGAPSPLPEPALQYGDFAVWQREWLAGDVLDAQLGYWRRKLAGAPPLLELPTDRPRPAVQTYAGAAESVVLAGDQAEAVLALGRREGSTLFMVLLAAMDVVLGRLAGQDDVVIGTPIAGRTRAETEGMIGLFLNSLALRTDLSGEPTFAQLLRRVRETTLEAYAHQDLPFERILEELAPERSLSHSPLFQVMLNLSNFAEGEMSLPGLEVQGIGSAGDLASKFDLTLYAGDGPQGIYMHLVYNTALFDAPRVRTMLAQLTGVLRQAAEDADRPVHAYSLLTDDAAALLPDPAAALSAEWRGSVPRIFARHAARTPDAVAVEDPAERWTYAQLDAASTAVAQRLMADGVRPGDVVAILGHRSAPIVRALLAAMKAGGAFLILDPAYPPARLAEYVRIARPTGFLPLGAAGEVAEELADALRETVLSTIPLAIRGNGFADKAVNPAEAHQPPPAVSGEVASLSEPEGACSGADRSASNPAPHQPPPGVFGGGASLSERRGRGGPGDSQSNAAEFADKAANSAEAHQPPPAVSGEVGEWCSPGGGRLGASGLVDKVADGPFPEIGPDSLAYLSFTSGTTGKPKAVMGRHGSLTHFTPWLAERFGLGASDRFSLLSGLAHDPLHRDVFTPLQLGAAVVAPDPDQVGTPGYLAEWMRDAGITVTHLTPAMGQLLVDVPGGLEGDAASADAQLPLSASNEREGGRGEGPTRVDSLRRAFFVGDVLTRTDVGRMHRLAPNLQVVNYYGSTETQRAVAHFVVPRDLAELARETIPVGTGIPDVQVLIRNAAGERVGVGEVGEIWMRSPHVALGYLGDPELTASRFIPNPWTGEAADPTYRTGDLGRYRPDGVAEIAGRADQQVKIRGFRIEPGEIEAALRAHAAVRDVVVVPRGQGDGKRLVAYVVADGEPAPRELRKWLRASVPDYMVPSAWVFLAALPVTPNGKVDRKALPEPETDAATRGFVPPRTPTEVALAGVWAALLNAPAVGADDDFFALGGHSLLATKLVARVRDAFGVELPLRTLFESPTLGALAASVDRLLRAGAGAVAPPIVHRPHEGTAPASFAQERLWFVDRMGGGGAVYHIPNAQLVSGPVSPDAMRRAVEEVVRRHETLRTALPEVDGVPVQRISPPGPVQMPFIDLSHLPEAERDAEAMRLAERGANEPFDMEAGPLFRASLVRVTEDEHLLLVNLHHVIGDGWSMRVLLGEISALHAAFRRGEPSPLPPLPVQYADYAAWQREWLAGPVLRAQLDYWRGRLAGAPPLLALPTDRPRPAEQGHNGASEMLLIGPDDAARIQELARREGATVFMVLLAALNVVLARWSGQDDVVVGTPVAGRTRSELEGLIGLFLNSLALRTDVSGNPSFRALLGRVREATLGAYAHQDVPFERILEDLKPERSLAHTPVFQVLLNLLNYRDAGGTEPGAEMTMLGAGAQLASKFDLTLYASETPHGIPLHAVYDADLFDAARMRSLLAQVAGVLRQAADDPDRPAAALSLVTDDAAPVLPDPSVPIEPEAWRGAVHQRVAAVAAARPDAPAVRDPRGTWTYAQVEAAAGRVAHRLAAAGVAPGDVVAVLAHRSAALVPALLGAWKAGAAFLVLDPAYPPARLAGYVRVASPRALVHLSAAGEVPADVAEALASTSLATVVLDGGVPVDDGAPPPAPGAPVGPDDLAYVAFTSGSTGEPKAIAGTHRPLPHFFGWYARTFGVGADDRFTLLSGLAHDPLLRDLFAPLLAGGTLVIPDPAQIGTPGYLAGWMRHEGVTVAHLTPAMGQLLATGGDEAAPALRLACFGGEALRAHDVRRLRAFAPGATVANFYGATETPQAMGAFVVPADLDDLPDVVPVGRGIDGVDLLVLRPDGARAGIGEVGEIVIRTPYLSRGYLNDGALTAARFAANPATGAPGDRMYRTGDLGRYRPDGGVQVAGRADDQVKLRGFRVEPGEVEAALRAHPGVGDAAVVAHGEGDAGRLAAYLVARGEQPRAAELRDALRGRLPDYMVPSAFVFVDALPLTPNGKLDRRALGRLRADPSEDASGPAAPEYVPPATEVERGMAELWRDVLGRERVGMADDFFELGGHSLLGVRLLARVRNLFGRVLPLAELFRSPTPRALAAAVAGTDARAGGCLVPIHPHGTHPPFFCVHPAGGTVFHFAELARLLGPRQPFYGVQAVGVHGEAEPLRTVPEMAERYLAELRRLQPHGPYFLGGWSAGGVVALEMAGRLRAAGHQVATVALLDARTPDFHQVRRVMDQVDLYHDHAATLVSAGEAELSALEAELRALAPERRLERLAAWLQARGAGLEAAEVDLFGASMAVFQATAAATREHHVRPYAGRVDLFRVKEETAGEGMEAVGLAEKWRALGLADLRVHDVPGTHTTLVLPPHVQVLAASLRDVLAQARPDAAGAETGP